MPGSYALVLPLIKGGPLSEVNIIRVSLKKSKDFISFKIIQTPKKEKVK